jgi:hypothetical protein
MKPDFDAFFAMEKAIHEYFGYVEDWRRLPLDDAREYFWRIEDGEGYGGSVVFHEDPAMLDDEDMNYYRNDIYTQRHLPTWVYRGEDFTLICVDTHSDGNQYLQIFDNAKEVEDPK